MRTECAGIETTIKIKPRLKTEALLLRVIITLISGFFYEIDIF
jgi:hypothetical protein